MTSELAAFVASQLRSDRVRAMSGGWGIYHDGEMVAARSPRGADVTGRLLEA